MVYADENIKYQPILDATRCALLIRLYLLHACLLPRTLGPSFVSTHDAAPCGVRRQGGTKLDLAEGKRLLNACPGSECKPNTYTIKQASGITPPTGVR